MSFQTYHSFIKEESGEDYYKFTPDSLNDLEKEIPLLSKMKNTFRGDMWIRSSVGSFHNQGITQRKGFITIPGGSEGKDFQIYLGGNRSRQKGFQRNGLEDAFNKFQEAGEVEILPDYFGDRTILEFKLDSGMKAGDLRMKEIYDWKDRHKIVFEYNAHTHDQIRGVIQKGIDLAIEKMRNARIIIKPLIIREKSEFYKKIKEELKTVYNEMINDFLKYGFLSPDDIDEDLFALALIKAAKDNPDFIKIVNDLPEGVKKKWFRYGYKIFRGEKIEFNKDTISDIQKIYDLKPAWNLI